MGRSSSPDMVMDLSVWLKAAECEPGHIQLVPRLRTRGYVQPLPHTPSWRFAHTQEQLLFRMLWKIRHISLVVITKLLLR
jgi:hypothetical protein